MVFANLSILIWLWLLPVLAAVFVFIYRKRNRRLANLVSSNNLKILAPKITGARLWFKATLVLVSLALIVLGLAEPRIGYEWKEVKHEGVDIIVAIDISKSMLAGDISPSRLERAKRKIIDLLPMLKGDRIGLLVFAGVAFVQCPLTVDYAAIRMFLDYINPELIPVQGTALSQAIDLGTKSLTEASPEGSNGHAIIIITDGEDQDSAPLAAAKRAHDRGVKIFTIGIGNADGAPIPEPNGGFKKDLSGNLVISKLNEKILQDIALETGGVYVRSVSGDFDLEKIYNLGIKKKTEDRELETSREKVWSERFQWFVGLALSLLLLEFFLPEYAGIKKRQKETVS